MNTQQTLESMSVYQLSYMLSKVLYHLYDFGGFSARRSRRSFLLELFMSVNCRMNVYGFDIFPHIEEAKNYAGDVIKSPPTVLLKGKLHIRNRKVLSAILLYKLMRHYQEEIIKNEELERKWQKRDSTVGVNDIDNSFKSQFPLFKLLYELYMIGVQLSVEILEEFSRRYDDERLRRLIEWTPKQLRN